MFQFKITQSEFDLFRDFIYEHAGIDATELSLTPIIEHSNLNNVVLISDQRIDLYAKSAPAIALDGTLEITPTRNRYEARALDIAEAIHSDVVTPRCVYVNNEYNFFVMESVCSSPRMLAGNNEYDLNALEEHSRAIGSWLAKFHSCANEFKRPIQQTLLLKNILFNHIYSPGAKAIFPNDWEGIIAKCMSHNEQLVHSDLWGKNLLIDGQGKIAILDFEGAMIGDGALDIASIICTGFFCISGFPERLPKWLSFSHQLIAAYLAVVPDKLNGNKTLDRVSSYLPLLIVHRTSGAFPFTMQEERKESLIKIALYLHAKNETSIDHNLKSMFDLYRAEFSTNQLSTP